MHQGVWTVFPSSSISTSLLPKTSAKLRSWCTLLVLFGAFILLNMFCMMIRVCSVHVISSTRFSDVEDGRSLLFVSSRTGFHFRHRKVVFLFTAVYAAYTPIFCKSQCVRSEVAKPCWNLCQVIVYRPKFAMKPLL